MTKQMWDRMGWGVAGCVGVVFAMSGFQSSEVKIGVVEMAQVVQASNYGKGQLQAFEKMKAEREEMLKFLSSNDVATAEQVKELRDLVRKNPRSEAETARYQALRAEITATTEKAKTLATKNDLTAEEKKDLEEYTRRAQGVDRALQGLYAAFTNEMQDWADDQKTAGRTKGNAVLKEIAKTQGMTIVFDSDVVPYGANDLSDATLKGLNAQ